MKSSRESGVALVGVLWIGLLLTVIAGSILYTARMQTYSARNGSDGAAAEAAANAGVSLAVATLYARLNDRLWRATGEARSFDLAGGTVVVSIQDEGGKIDLNSAEEPLLESLLEANGASPNEASGLAAAIADWRDRDDDRRLNGAEERDYRASGRSSGPKNAPFERLDELRRVLGVSADLFDRLAPALTVHSGRRGVDPAVAPRAVLRALPGIDEELLDQIERTTDPVERARLVRDAVSDRRSISNSSRRSFRVRAEARTPSGGSYVRESVVRLNTGSSDLDPGNQPYFVLDWKRGRAVEPAQPGVGSNQARSM